MDTPRNSAERIEATLLRGILRGEHPPGSRLPPVRELAARFGVNQATIQRVLAGLEARGLVQAKPGSGVLVHDPREVGDLGLLPLWLELALDDPPRAGRLVAQFLALRRAVAARLLVRHREALLEAPVLLEAANGLARAETALDAAKADLALARALLRRSDDLGSLAVLNAAGRVLEAVPTLAHAMYADPRENGESVAELLQALAAGAGPEALEAVIARVDARTVERFVRALETAQGRGTPS